MISKLKFFCIILYFIFCMNVVYGSEINNIDGLLDDFISLEDKLEYLNFIKNENDHSFFSSDIDKLIKAFSKHDTLQPYILEILLQDSINESNLTQSQMSDIALMVISEIGMKNLESEQNYKERRYLSLKLLIKINELKTNSDTYYDKTLRDAFKMLFEYVFGDDSHNTTNTTNTFSEEKTIDRFKEWEHRDMVENFIFDPIVLEMNDEYIENNEQVLRDYELYLLDHIRFFPITTNLKRLVENVFFKTKFPEFRSQYISSMFYIDMRKTLIKIISDRSIDPNLRIQAMSVSVELLNQVDVLDFKIFSNSLLKEMKKISSSLNKKDDSGIKLTWDEEEKLVKVAKEKMKIIKHIINQHDDMKDLEYVIFDPNISKKEKIIYLKNMLESGFCFPKEQLGFVKKVFDSDLDIEIKAEISYIALYGNTTEELLDYLNQYDIDSMGFLFKRIIEPKLYLQIFSNSKDKYNKYQSKYTIKILADKDEIIRPFIGKGITENSLKLYYRFDMWEDLIEDIQSLGLQSSEYSVLRSKIIRTSLDLLIKTKDFDKFNEAFLETLQKISEDRGELNDTRNIANYILHTVKQAELSLNKNDIEEGRKQEKLRSTYESMIRQVQLMISDQEKREQEYKRKFVNIKELEGHIYSSDLSIGDKLWYLDDIFKLNLYFSKDHLEFINKVLNDGKLDTKIIFTMAALVILKSTEDLVDEMDIEDIKYMRFLATYGQTLISKSDRGKRVYIFNEQYVVDLDHSIYNKKINISDILMGIVDAKSTIRFFYNRSNMFILTEIMVDQSKDEDIRKLAITAGIKLFYKFGVKDIIEKEMFIRALRRMSKSEHVSTKLRNIANYIIEQVDQIKPEISTKVSDCSHVFKM